MTSGSRAVAKVLLASVRGEGWRDPPAALGTELTTGVNPSELSAAAGFHGVAGYVHHALAAAGAPDAARLVAPAYRGALRAHLQGLAMLERVAAVLDPAGIPWLVVKGPVLAAVAHAREDLRGYSDLDVLVPPSAFPDALPALERLGGEARVRSWAFHHRHGAGEVPIVFEDGTVVDLHWHLCNTPELRRTFLIDTGSLFARARTIPIGATDVRTLDPVDGLLHLGLHTCTSGANRLIWLKDIEGWLAQQAPDTDGIVQRAHRWRVALPLAVMLAKVNHVLGTKIDPDLIHRLAPQPGWRTLFRWLWSMVPPAAARQGPSLDRLVMRSVRTDLPDTAATFGRKVGRGIAGRLSRTTEQPLTATDREDRRSYLSAVASGGV